MGIFSDKLEPSDAVIKGYHFNRLPNYLKREYDSIANGILTFQKKIQLDSVKDKKDIERIFDSFLFDNPQICYINPNVFQIHPSSSGYSILIDYVYDKKKAVQVQNRVKEQVDSIIQQFVSDNMDDYEKCLAVHDYLTANIRYNFSALSVEYVYDAFTAEGAILKHQSVCMGIAKAMALLLNKVGVWCTIIQGSSIIDEQDIRHAWNIVKINDSYYHIDATWDLQEVNHFSNRSHMYVNLDDTSILVNHTWDLEWYPTCDSYEENYYVKEKRYFKSMRSFELYVQQFLKYYMRYMDIRFDDTLDIPDDGGEMLAKIIQKNSQIIDRSYNISYLFNACNFVFQAEISYL